MNWHQPTKDEIDGHGDYRYIIDIMPDTGPHQATTDGDALVRVSQPGWSWQVLDLGQTPPRFVGDVGFATNRSIAVAEAMEFLGSLRSREAA